MTYLGVDLRCGVGEHQFDEIYGVGEDCSVQRRHSVLVLDGQFGIVLVLGRERR